MSERFDQIAGALLGVHVGDSLGATTEFSDRARAQTLLPETVEATTIVGGGIFGWAAGAATDDTDLTLAITRAYLATGCGDTDIVTRTAADNMLGWMRGDPRDIGGATADGLRAYASSRDPFTSGGTQERAQGNGSLMRTVPVALVRLDDPRRRAVEAATLSSITHAHPHCRDACIVYCDLIADLITGRSVAQRSSHDRKTLIDLVRTRAVDKRLAGAVRGAILDALDVPLGDITGVNGDAQGWVLTALQVAIAALTDGRPAAEILLDVARLGGDADTNAAIAGGILGARDGIEAWPERWIADLEHGDELLAAAASFDRN